MFSEQLFRLLVGLANLALFLGWVLLFLIGITLIRVADSGIGWAIVGGVVWFVVAAVRNRENR